LPINIYRTPAKCSEIIAVWCGAFFMDVTAHCLYMSSRVVWQIAHSLSSGAMQLLLGNKIYLLHALTSDNISRRSKTVQGAGALQLLSTEITLARSCATFQQFSARGDQGKLSRRAGAQVPHLHIAYTYLMVSLITLLQQHGPSHHRHHLILE